jgi:hypothetical protein
MRDFDPMATAVSPTHNASEVLVIADDFLVSLPDRRRRTFPFAHIQS